jgi:antitoxin component of MazEF toxin-antitoxin module
MVIKNLRPIGNSVGVIIDSAILDMLGLAVGSPVQFTFTADNKGLIMTPADDEAVLAHKSRVRKASHRVMKAHDETLRKLAE